MNLISRFFTMRQNVFRHFVAIVIFPLCLSSALADAEDLRISSNASVNFSPTGCITNIVSKKQIVVSGGGLMAEKKLGEGTNKSVIHQGWGSIVNNEAKYQAKDGGDEFTGTILDSKTPGSPKELDFSVLYTKLTENKLNIHVTVTYVADTKWVRLPFYQFQFPWSAYADGNVTSLTAKGQEENTSLSSDKTIPFKGIYTQVMIAKEKQSILIESSDGCEMSICDARQWNENYIRISVAPKTKEWKEVYTPSAGEKFSFDVIVTVKADD